MFVAEKCICAINTQEMPWGLYRINCLLSNDENAVAAQAERNPHIIYFIADNYFTSED
jgi:hypothetical protein